MAKVSIIGSGYVGASIGQLLLGKNDVIFYDINKELIERLKNDGYKATDDITEAMGKSDVSFICVPTPTKDGKIDLSYIKSATEAVGKQLKQKDTYHLVVVKSTVIPTTTETIVKEILENYSGKVCGKDFGLCASPEFLTQVNKTTTDPELKRWYEANPFSIKKFEDKIVIGEYDHKSGEVLEELFKPLNVPIFRTDAKTAEMIKYAHNLNLASKISYWNELFLICQAFGIDSKKVAEIVSTDNRIGKYGTVHGKAFGGNCLPKDLEAFVSFLKERNVETKGLEAVLDINNFMSKKYGVRE
ncbi:MAG: nucleotide sugar dehydrogenase [Candidatus Aenigmarchaeota archaeon]|nr:nucleotide sugar dehydrogenase [Candidatus Aenigmarchaeota archaeon]